VRGSSKRCVFSLVRRSLLPEQITQPGRLNPEVGTTVKAQPGRAGLVEAGVVDGGVEPFLRTTLGCMALRSGRVRT